MKTRIQILAVVGIFLVVSGFLARALDKPKVQPQQQNHFALKSTELESPPTTVRGKVIQEFEAKQKARDQALAAHFRKQFVEEPNTPSNHTLLVPHQVLDQPVAEKPKPTHSVLVQKTCTVERHDSETCRQNGNFNLRRIVPSFGRFGF